MPVDILPAGPQGISAGVIPWTAMLPVGKNISNFYDSLGDVTISTATYLPTTQDGAIRYFKYNNLTVNALLGLSARCRGVIIDCNNFTGGAAGGLLATGMGAQGQSNWPIVDLTIPNTLTLSAANISQKAALDYIRKNNIFLGDEVFWAFPDAGVGDCRKSASQPGTTLVSALGCGLGANGVRTSSSSTYNYNTGANGVAGVAAPGSGASGGIQVYADYGATGPGGRAYPWGGGQGGEGVYPNAGTARVWGWPGELVKITQPGAVCIVIVRGNLSLASGFVAQADGIVPTTGMPDGYSFSIGGPGGGAMRFYVGGTISNSGTVRANGAVGQQSNTSASKGGDGGNGVADIQPLTALGWS